MSETVIDFQFQLIMGCPCHLHVSAPRPLSNGRIYGSELARLMLLSVFK